MSYVKLIAAVVCSLLAASAAPAEVWSFTYGPEFGGKPNESFTRVESGRNMLQLQEYGNTGILMLGVVIDRLGAGEALSKNLQAGEALKIEVVTEEGRYERVIPTNEFRMDDAPDAQKTFVYLRVLTADIEKMSFGTSMFIAAGSMKYRFGMENAKRAIDNLIEALIQEGK